MKDSVWDVGNSFFSRLAPIDKWRIVALTSTRPGSLESLDTTTWNCRVGRISSTGLSKRNVEQDDVSKEIKVRNFFNRTSWKKMTHHMRKMVTPTKTRNSDPMPIMATIQMLNSSSPVTRERLIHFKTKVCDLENSDLFTRLWLLQLLSVSRR